MATYWHCLPLFAQARKAIWTAVNPHTGTRRIDEAFPVELRESTNDQEMFIRFLNGSTWQVIGSDRYDTLVGSSVAGVVFSEWALANPSAWAYIRPMVEENDGWAAFITTPRGNNHAKTMYDMAVENPSWFAEVSDVTKTGALTQSQLDESLEEYQAIYGEDFGRAMYLQEYFCDFSGAQIGAYFGAEMNAAEREGRITDVPIDERYPVHTAWDLGKAANNPIWCFQVIPQYEEGKFVGNVPHIVDFYRPQSDDLEDWIAWLKKRDYTGTDYLPHDALPKIWGTGKTRIDLLRDLGRKPWPIPIASIEDGRTAARQTIKLARFDRTRCSLGIDGLKNYRREWDDDLKRFRDNPVKDWAEHIGSAFRYLGFAWKDHAQKDLVPPPDKPINTALPTLADLQKQHLRRNRRGRARI